MKKQAYLSEDQLYRYYLYRSWDDTKRSCFFLALNPSTADAVIDDPTVKKCIGYSKLQDYGSFYLLNLFAYRATFPSDLKKAEEPVGPENDAYLRRFALLSKLCGDSEIVCCFGDPHKSQRGRVSEVLALLADVEVTPVCIGVTKHLWPKHPSRAAYVKTFYSWEAPC